MTTPTRDPDRERRLLAASAPGDPHWPTLVAARLDIGEHLYGNRWATQPLLALIREIDEEALDIAAWSVLSLQALDHADLQPADRNRMESLLAGVTHQAAQIHHCLHTAHLLAKHPQGGVGGKNFKPNGHTTRRRNQSPPEQFSARGWR